MKPNILVVGCGSIGERHLRCLLRTDRAEVIACEPKAELRERIQQEYDVKTFASMDDALATQKLDGVVLCTPAHTHVPLALSVLRHGAGVLIEKPLSINLEYVEELKAAARSSGHFVGIAYVYHFMPAVQHSREFLKQGSLGAPLHVSVVSGQHFPTYRPAYREIYYTRHETGGGAIQDALTHMVNAVEWMIGPTTRLYCEAAHQALEGVHVEDTVSVTSKHGNVLANFSLNQFQAPNETTIQINCERGSLKIEVHEQRWGVFPRGASTWEYRPTPVAHRDDLFTSQANAFLDGLAGKPTSLCTLDEAIQTLKFNIAALESARDNKPVAIL